MGYGDRLLYCLLTIDVLVFFDFVQDNVSNF